MGARPLSLSISQLIYCHNGSLLICVSLFLQANKFSIQTDIVVIYIFLHSYTRIPLASCHQKSNWNKFLYVYVRFVNGFLFSSSTMDEAALQQQQFISIFFHLLCVTLTLLSDLTLLFGMCFINSWAWCVFFFFRSPRFLQTIEMNFFTSFFSGFLFLLW